MLAHASSHERWALLVPAHCSGPKALERPYFPLILDGHVVIGDLSASYDSQSSTCIHIPRLRALQVALGYKGSFPLA